MANKGTERLVRIQFDLDPKQWPTIESESLWAEELDTGEYVIRNSPFYIYGISAADVVYARSVDGILTFASVARRGGHSTYRILLTESITLESPLFIENWRPLQHIGCMYELAKSRWLGVDVPASTDIFVAYKFLETGEAAGVWTFEESHCGHMVNEHHGGSPLPSRN